jgi:hypothetical protein
VCIVLSVSEVVQIVVLRIGLWMQFMMISAVGRVRPGTRVVVLLAVNQASD